ncbi:MAG: ABC transporter permease [Alphaproteobacteria bacterium]|nr:ABC transporter permease [Alphaproteobacteria bacterium]
MSRNSFLVFVLTKSVRATLTMLLLVSLVFFTLRLAGDPAEILLEPDASAEMIEEFAQKWGLDRPLWEQYSLYLRNAMAGDFGQSFHDGRDALKVVLEHAPKTLLLAGVALGLSLLIGLPLGTVAALRRDGPVDRIAMTLSVVGYAIPNFFLAVILMLIFAVQLSLLPTAGSATIWHLILPAITIGTSGAGAIARFTRSAVLETLEQPYMRAARGRGVLGARLIVRHAFPNAAIPVVTVVGFMVGGLISGAIITETVFAWPGIGRLFVYSVNSRDIPVVQVIILLSAASMVVTNLLVDMAYGWLDPRIRLHRSGK